MRRGRGGEEEEMRRRRRREEETRGEERERAFLQGQDKGGGEGEEMRTGGRGKGSRQAKLALRLAGQ